MNGWQIFVEVPGHAPVEVKGGESIVGRSRTSQVHVNDSTVSRHHARLLAGSLGDVSIEDLGSSNGTYVNGQKIDGRRKLADGDRILIGDVELRLRITAPIAASEATVRMSLPPLGPPPAVPMAAPARAPQPSPPPPSPPPPTRADPPPPPPPAAAQVPPLTMPFPQQTAPPPPPPPSSWTSAPARTIDPPLHAEPAPRPAPAPRAEPRPAAPAAAAAVAEPAPGRRGDVLPSVTAIDRIPIPEPGPEVRERARLSRAKPAGFWVRVVAMLVDSALLAVVGVLLSALGLLVPGPAAVKMAVIYGIATGLSLAYPLVFWATRGATPGKMLMGLAVVAAGTTPGHGIGWGPAILRALGYVASGLILGIGFLLVAFTSQKQGLHDLIAGTRVLKLR